MESWPWTRVAGVEPPSAHKSPVDLSNRDDLSLARYREQLGDGSFGGDYERSDDEMRGVWSIAVEETRARLAEGW
jgi:creatinine amidohydrolase